jgi:prepilin-type N-terminal cleavage/methylation domain-containing protein
MQIKMASICHLALRNLTDYIKIPAKNNIKQTIFDSSILYNKITYFERRVYEMPMTKLVKNNKGLTLIETMLSITILGIVMLGVMTLFKQAYLYTILNEDKTVGINVARNALMYMKKQSFIELKNYFTDTDKKLKILICETTDENGNTIENYQFFAEAASIPATCENIEINNTKYDITVQAEENNQNYQNYFIPIKVIVAWEKNNIKRSTELKGVITSEDIR